MNTFSSFSFLKSFFNGVGKRRVLNGKVFGLKFCVLNRPDALTFVVGLEVTGCNVGKGGIAGSDTALDSVGSFPKIMKIFGMSSINKA